MAKFNFCYLPGLIAWLLYLTLVASSYLVEKRFGDPPAASQITEIPLHERSDLYDNGANSSSALVKRTVFNLGSNKPEDARILQQAFTDMVEIVTYVQQNPNPAVLARYFSPNDQGDVTAIFNTVRQLAQPGGFPNPPPQLRPIDLSQIAIHRGGTGGGIGTTLAESFETSATSTHPRIDLYDFGWGALHKRLRSEVNCDCDIKKTNYKMYILGSVLLHETLHFNIVPNLAWVHAPNPPLQPNQCLDDQPGDFPTASVGTNKAYGPYEAMKLLNRDPAAAKLNIENYLWYAMETYWLHECPNAPVRNGMFKAPDSNDIPAVCKQAAKGWWCWIF